MRSLAQLAPATVSQASDPCLKAASVVIPYDSLGDNFRAALSAAEAKEDGHGVLSEVFPEFWPQRPARVTLSLQISRTMFCDSARTLNRQLDELRAAVQLEHRFSRRELFTMLANRITFGEDVVGVEPASRHFFHKQPNQLLVGEAALLAGLVRAPSYFSPIKHPDRALQRRNEVIDAMVEAHAISQLEGSTAKASPLPIN
ncbi:MAG: penicillin-binding protein family [Acidobacteriaceae bacterium]|nr:penicillin-binding protein family [Acidobacteriaceae bacterium]